MMDYIQLKVTVFPCVWWIVEYFHLGRITMLTPHVHLLEQKITSSHSVILRIHAKKFYGDIITEQ